MRSEGIKLSHLNIVVSLSDIRRERERACSPFGPARAGLITLQTTNKAQPMGLHSTWERKVKTHASKSLEACDTLKLGTITALAKRSSTPTEGAGTDER